MGQNKTSPGWGARFIRVTSDSELSRYPDWLTFTANFSTSASIKSWTNTDAPIFIWIHAKWQRERWIELSTL